MIAGGFFESFFSLTFKTRRFKLGRFLEAGP
jgi:hypothetical protein